MTKALRPLPAPLEILRWIFILGLWALWLGLRLLVQVAGLLREVLVPGRVQNAFLLALLAVLALASWVLVPVGWGWYELRDAAQHLALRAAQSDDEAIRLQLKRLAFRKGFVEILETPDAIQIERVEDPADPRCRIIIRLDHRLRWNDHAGPILPIRLQVDRSMLPTAPERPQEERLLDLLD